MRTCLKTPQLPHPRQTRTQSHTQNPYRDYFSLLSTSPATSLPSSPAGPQFFLLHAIKRGSLFRLDLSTSHEWESGLSRSATSGCFSFFWGLRLNAPDHCGPVSCRVVSSRQRALGSPHGAPAERRRRGSRASPGGREGVRASGRCSPASVTADGTSLEGGRERRLCPARRPQPGPSL